MPDRKPFTPLPSDAAAHVARLPGWLQEEAAGAFVAVDEAGARRAAQAARDAEHARRRQELIATAQDALAGKWGKTVAASATTLLGSVPVREAETAILISIEFAVRAEQKERRERRSVEKFGRSAK